MPETVLITGAGRGLGLALASACAARGDHVIGTVRDPDRVPDLAALPGVVLRTLDMTASDGIADAIARFADEAGGVDLVIANAGVNYRGVTDGEATLSIETMAAAPMLELLRVNAIGPLLVARGALPHLERSPHGRVVMIGSWLGSIEGLAPGDAANYGYRMSKAALTMGTRALAAEAGPRGVTAVTVNPGWMQTSMGGPRAELTPEGSAAGILRIADGLTPEDGGRFLDWDGVPRAF